MKVRNPIKKFQVYDPIVRRRKYFLFALVAAIFFAAANFIRAKAEDVAGEVVARADQREQLLDAYSLFIAACMSGRAIVVGNDAVQCFKL